MVTIYGLKNCDTCRKAVKSLDSNGLAVSLRDVRAEPLSRDELDAFFSIFGEKLLNTRSTTWRGLDEADRARDPMDLIAVYPALMKRPVVVSDYGTTLGWSGVNEALHLGKSTGAS